MSDIRPGDVFSIPTGATGRAFGRVLSEKKAVGLLVEVFAQVAETDERPDPGEVTASGRLFRPLYVSTPSYRKAGWTLLARDDGFDGADSDEIGFVLGRSAGTVRMIRGGTTQTVSEEEALGMEEMIVHTPGRVRVLVREALGLPPAVDA